MLALDGRDRIADGEHQFKEPCRRFSLSEIQSATNDFDEALVIGKGGFGKVYKGFIDDGATTVAIKRLETESKQGAKEFWTEIKTLSKIRHTYLLTLIGYSDDCEEMILVYEYMVNGTLADHLYKNSRKGIGNHIYHLTWEQRLKICIAAARGLNYLHTEQSVIHRDVKSTNMLLDQNWIAKISDFGLSRRGATNQTQTHISTDVKGTFGYFDPEYFLTSRLTKKSDVYAFGVVLFEVLCARPAVDFRVEEDQCSLALWVLQCIKKGIIDQIVDPSLKGQIKTHCLKMFVEIANKCLHNHPRGRPTMAEVAESLELVLTSQSSIVQRKGKIFSISLRYGEPYVIRVEASWVPQRCPKCEIFGHILKNCLNTQENVKTSKQIWRKKEETVNKNTSDGWIEVNTRKENGSQVSHGEGIAQAPKKHTEASTSYTLKSSNAFDILLEEDYIEDEQNPIHIIPSPIDPMLKSHSPSNVANKIKSDDKGKSNSVSRDENMRKLNEKIRNLSTARKKDF